MESDYCRSTHWGLRIAYPIKRQREAHAEYKYSPCYYIVKVRVCVHVYTQMLYHNRHKRDNLYPVGHLSLLCSYWTRNLRDFKASEQSANKRLFNMSATLRWRCTDTPGAGSRCKDTIFFWHEQIFLKKVYSWRFIVKDLPEYDSGLINKEVSARMRMRCTIIARRNNAVV